MRELSGVSMVRALIPLVQAPPSNTTTVGTRVLCVHFMGEGDTDVQSIAGSLTMGLRWGYHPQLIMTAA